MYGDITAIEVSAAVVGLAVAIIASLIGWGYWALIVQQIVAALSTIVLLWVRCSWRPGRMVFHKESLGGFAFGGALTLGQFFDFLRKNLDVVIIRKFTDEAQLGYYGRAHRIVLMPVMQIMQPLMNVALPLLSRRQNDVGYHDTFENIFRFSMAFAVPFGVFCFFFPDSVVVVLLGNNWLEAIPIVRALGVVAILHPIGNCLAINLIVFKKMKIMVLMPVITSVLSIFAYLFGIQDGVVRLAEYYAVVVGLMIPVYCFLVVRSTPVCGGKLVRLSLPLIFCMGISVSTVELAENFWSFEAGSLQHFVRFLTFGIVYALVVLFGFGYSKRVLEIYRLVKK